ncbi:MAG: type III pantothenate kinase [Candidatus Jettenia sp. CY-1]|nr:MAG: type III pantothenate kinase [Candidatus Jettenia sp. CY-1]
MLLAVDIGNTNIHIGIFEEDILHSSYSLGISSSHAFQVNFTEVLSSTIISRPKVAILSSVNPKTEAFVIEYIKKYLLIKPWRIGKDIPIPVLVLTDYPERVGIDRLVNAVAAFKRTKDWTIIIDAGTAITIDVINNTGAFIGGIIAPGIDISSKALHNYTALLPEISVHKPKHILGKRTEEAINSGIYWGTVGMVNKLINMLYDELKCKPRILATGGNASMLAQEIPLISEVIPHLTLEGIQTTYTISLISNKRG